MKWTEDFVYGPVFREISERPLDSLAVDDQVPVLTIALHSVSRFKIRIPLLAYTVHHAGE